MLRWRKPSGSCATIRTGAEAASRQSTRVALSDLRRALSSRFASANPQPVLSRSVLMNFNPAASHYRRKTRLVAFCRQDHSKTPFAAEAGTLALIDEFDRKHGVISE